MLTAAISLTTPLMLGGLGLLAFPIIAHLMHRFSRRTVVFPTIELLVASAANQSRLFKLRRWVLLALRCLAIVLLVVAFARPVWHESPTAASGSGSTATVIVLDASLSTQQQVSGVPALELLRGSVGRVLDSLATDDVANVVIASGETTSLLPRLSVNHPLLRSELSRVEATYEPADFLAALALSGRLLAGYDGPRRLVVVSDLQRANWQFVRASNLGELLPTDTEVSVVDPSFPVAGNVGLSDPRTFPRQPLAGQAVQVIVRAANYSREARQVPVTVEIDGESAGSQTVTLPAGEEQDVAFQHQVEAAGYHDVVFRTGDDDLLPDNVAYLAIKAADRLPVVVVGDDDPAEPGSGSFFLTRALAPHGSDLDRYGLQHVTSSELATADLASTTCVFMGYVGALDAAAAQRLVEHVRQGGGVVMFCGDGAADRHLLALERAAGEEGLSPFQLGPARNLSLFDDALTISSGKWQARLLRQFDEQSQLALSRIRFGRVWSAGAVHAEAQVLLSFSDGTPALASWGLGSGQFVLANFSPALGSSDLGKYGAFVALTQILAKELGQPAAARGDNFVGQPYRFDSTLAVSLDEPLLAVMGPNDEPTPHSLLPTNRNATLQITRPSRPGLYRVRRGDDAVAVAAINVDPAESDLDRIAPGEVLKCLEISGLTSKVERSAVFGAVGRGGGRPLWGWLVAAAMTILGVELLLLGMWRR